MKCARLVKTKRITFCERTGKARIEFSVDRLQHTVNALYHDPPPLPRAIWQSCVLDVALACLVDVAAASLGQRITLASADVGPLGTSVFREAITNQYLEVLWGCKGSLRLLPAVTASERSRSFALHSQPRADRILLMMGGGKDSLYAFHVLRQAGYDVRCFYMVEPSRSWQQLRRVYANLGGTVTQYRAFLNANQVGRIEKAFRRSFDTQHQIGQAISLALPYAIAYRCQYIAVGSEKSSDLPARTYRGREINHQYDKSAKFIRRVNRYLKWRYSGAVQVISPIHGLYDIGIYARFLKEGGDLVELQSSCGGANTFYKHCGQCEKCGFVAALFAGLCGDRDRFARLFPRDPLQDMSLFEDWFRGRCHRPVACVGVFDELRAAIEFANGRGWRSGLQDYYNKRRFPPVRASTLRRLLAIHGNKLLPEGVQQRLLPMMQFEPDELIEVLRTGQHLGRKRT